MNSRKSVKRIFGTVSLSAACLVVSSQALAVSNFTPGDVSAVTTNAANALIRTVALGTDYRAYMPATPLGYMLGLDVGMDVTLLSLPSDFTDAIALATQSSSSQIPTLIPVPKINVHKGLPFGIDLGFTYSAIPDSSQPGINIFSHYAGAVKWTFLRGAALPSVAARVSASYSNLYFMKTRSYVADIVVSKKLPVIDPYVGAGVQLWSGDLDVPLEGAGGLSSTVSANQSSASLHVYVGLPLKVFVLKLTPQIEYSTAGLTTYGAKVSLAL